MGFSGGLNTTGRPDTTNHALGRGKLYLCRLGAADVKTDGYRDVGNAPKFNYKVTTQELEHMSSRAGIKDVDASVITERKISGSFTIDEIDFNNLALNAGGVATAGNTNAAVAGFAEYGMIASAVLGRWYPIVNSSGVRAYNVLAADLTVEKSGSPDVAMVKDTDYLLDSDMGMIFLLTTSIVVANGDTVDVTLAANAAAKTLDVVKALTDVSARYAIKFLSLNPVTNDIEQEFEFHKCLVRASSDDELIGDKFRELAFEFTAYKTTEAAAVADNSTLLTITTHSKADNDLTA